MWGGTFWGAVKGNFLYFISPMFSHKQWFLPVNDQHFDLNYSLIYVCFWLDLFLTKTIGRKITLSLENLNVKQGFCSLFASQCVPVFLLCVFECVCDMWGRERDRIGGVTSLIG